MKTEDQIRKKVNSLSSELRKLEHDREQFLRERWNAHHLQSVDAKIEHLEQRIHTLKWVLSLT